MSCTVIGPGLDRRRTVKNLRWLLDHRHEVVRFEAVAGREPGGATLWTLLDGDRRFVADFADIRVLAGFLADRRAWRTVRILWFGEEGMVGKTGIVGLRGHLQKGV